MQKLIQYFTQINFAAPSIRFDHWKHFFDLTMAVQFCLFLLQVAYGLTAILILARGIYCVRYVQKILNVSSVSKYASIWTND